MDAERDHAKSELEQFKVDITSAMKQMGALEKALGKKVLSSTFFHCSWGRFPLLACKVLLLM
jgi:hypothetical protein